MSVDISILPMHRFSVTNLLSFVTRSTQLDAQNRESSPPHEVSFMSGEAQSEHSDELALLTAISRGDQIAFSAFYDRFSRPVFALALSILRSQSDAEDVLQEVMVKVWAKAQAYSPRAGKPLSWIMTMTRNHAIDRLRSSKRQQELHREAGDESNLHPIEHDTRQETERRESATVIQSAMSDLPKEQRQAINLAYFHGLTHSEIASNLNQPVGTIKARIRRGMQRLRSRLAEAN